MNSMRPRCGHCRSHAAAAIDLRRATVLRIELELFLRAVRVRLLDQVAAAVVDVFQTTVDKIVLLAVLMPVVPSMGGVAGNQSLIIITRAIALGQIDRSNARRIMLKELRVGLLNGIGWAIVVATFTYLWFSNWRIGGVIGAAMIINLFVAAMAGFLIPVTLKRLNIDPALAGGVVLTTITDVVGYMAFLGLGAALLL